MIVPKFTFDAEANGYISEPFVIDGRAVAHVELSSRAPIVTLKKEDDGDFANYGQTPKSGTDFEITINTKREECLRLATPVEVAKCYILN